MKMATAAVTELQTPHDLVQIAQLDPDCVAANWGRLYPFVQKLGTREPVFMLPEDILPLMRQGRVQLWIGNDASAIRAVGLTKVSVLPRMKYCQILWFCALDFLPYVAVLEGVEVWARELGCDYMQVSGRRGWIRVLKPFGYRLYGMDLMKPLRAATEH